jgi:hypothetical protein
MTSQSPESEWFLYPGISMHSYLNMLLASYGQKRDEDLHNQLLTVTDTLNERAA